MQKHFNKEPVMTKKMTKILITSLNVGFVIKYYDGDDDNKEALLKDCNIKG